MAPDKRSGKIVVASHCILNVHSLEDNLAIYPGMEEEVVQLLLHKGVGIYQIPCPEMELSSIFRKALPKEAYDHPKIRKVYRQLAENITRTLNSFAKKGYEIQAIIGAEGSPACGVGLVGRWKKNIEGKKEFPRDVEFVPGMGVFMEELKACLDEKGIHPARIGIPGKSLRSLHETSFILTLKKLERIL